MIAEVKSEPAVTFDFAQEIQRKTAQIVQLAQIISQELCNLPHCNSCLTARRSTDERAILLLDLVESIAAQALDIGEKIESADSKVRNSINA